MGLLIFLSGCLFKNSLVRSLSEMDACKMSFHYIDEDFSLTDTEFKKKHGVDKPATPGSQIVVHCRTGRKASHALTALVAKGFSQ